VGNAGGVRVDPGGLIRAHKPRSQTISSKCQLCLADIRGGRERRWGASGGGESKGEGMNMSPVWLNRGGELGGVEPWRRNSEVEKESPRRVGGRAGSKQEYCVELADQCDCASACCGSIRS